MGPTQAGSDSSWSCGRGGLGPGRGAGPRCREKDTHLDLCIYVARPRSKETSAFLLQSPFVFFTRLPSKFLQTVDSILPSFLILLGTEVSKGAEEFCQRRMEKGGASWS